MGKGGYVDEDGNDVSTEDAAQQLQSMGETVYKSTAEETNETNNENQAQGPGDGGSFSTLWNNYPGNHIDHIDPKTKKECYDNQCAMELSEALIKSGISMKGFKGATCKNCSLGEKHALSAEQLADFLLKPSRKIGQ